MRNEGFFGPERAINPTRHFVVSVNLFGNGISSSPSNTPSPCNAGNFPQITFYDNIRAQHRLLTEALDVHRLALVAGWSMAGCQAFQWGAQYPDFVDAIVPICASAKTSEHNIVFLEGVKAALTADAVYNNGNYRTPPVKGLKAFGPRLRWLGFFTNLLPRSNVPTQGFRYRRGITAGIGSRTISTGTRTTCCASSRPGSLATLAHSQPMLTILVAALNAIEAQTIVIACDNDLYFRPEDKSNRNRAYPQGGFSNLPIAVGSLRGIPGKRLRIRNVPRSGDA